MGNQMGEPKVTLEVQRLVLRSGLWALAGLLLFVVIMGLIPQPQLTGIPLKLLGLGLALVPALLWLLFFLAQNRKHPEPKRIVLRVFFFSAIAASGAGIRLVDELFKLETWLPQDLWPRLLALILIIGFSQEFLKYLVVRYTVFTTEDYLERTDGILYGIVAGLGYATALNMNYVLSNQGVLLFVGSMHMVVTALAQAGFSAVGGYFLAGAKFGEKPIWWMPSGIILAAVLNGTFTHLRRELIARGFTYTPWSAFLLALGFAIVVLVILFALTQRAEQRNRAAIS
jgi:RsiW-degrading membrane proteinase PrsW (M82 family)